MLAFQSRRRSLGRRFAGCSLVLSVTLGCSVTAKTGRSLPTADSPPQTKSVPATVSLASPDRDAQESHTGDAESGTEIERTAAEEIVPPNPVGGVPEPEVAVSILAATDAGLTLAQLEQLALEHNPTIRQSSASVSKGTAWRSQVGVPPNPTLGYTGGQLADRGTDQHLLFIEQEFVTGKKLEWNRTVLDRGVQAQLWDVETRRLRVLTDVRRLYFEALAAQRRKEQFDGFHQLLVKGVEIARLRMEALEGTRTEVLQAEIQLQEIALARRQADLAYHGAWNELASIVGLPELGCRTLVGELPIDLTSRDWCAACAELLAHSPELQAAQAKARQALAMLSRQEVQAIPNLIVQFGAGVDNSTDSGMMQLQVQAPIPIRNDNGGNISAAQAEYCRATHDVRRVEMAIRARLAQTAQAYDSALAAVAVSRDEILPRSERTLELAEGAYQAGEMDFLQVLVVRRTYFEVHLAYIDALRDLARADAALQGLLLTGGLDAPDDFPGDAGVRDQTFSQQ